MWRFFYYKILIVCLRRHAHVISTCAEKLITHDHDINYCTNECKFQQYNTKLKSQSETENLKVTEKELKSLSS